MSSRFKPGERPFGRTKGTPNKATADVKALAGKYGADAIAKLAELADLVPGKAAAESEQARVAALKELLDRAYGKARQPLTGEEGHPPVSPPPDLTGLTLEQLRALSSIRLPADA